MTWSIVGDPKKAEDGKVGENSMEEAASARVPERVAAIERADGASPVLLVCDHASNHLPSRYGSLGLGADDLLKHFAWDPGALAISRRLSELLDAPLVYGCVSRLCIDVNRDPSDFNSIAETADGVAVPGNAALSTAERERRVAEVYAPFHAALAGLLAQRKGQGIRSALVSIHTYAPSLHGIVRPWHCGVIFACDARMGEALVAGLRAEGGLAIGVNEPYAPSDRVYHTMSRHGEDNHNPAVMIEVRHDLVLTADGQSEWAMRLAPLLHRAAHMSLDLGGGEIPKNRAIA